MGQSANICPALVALAMAAVPACRLRFAGPPWRPRPGAGEHAGRLRQGARDRRHDAGDRSRRYQGWRAWCSRTTPCSTPISCAGPTTSGSPRRGLPSTRLTLAEIKRFDVGRLDSVWQVCGASFPDRRPSTESASLRLEELFEWSGGRERRCVSTSRPSCRPRTAGADARSGYLRPSGGGGNPCRRPHAVRAAIQSFDWRTLLAAKKLAPEIETACLTYEKTLQGRVEGSGRRRSPWLAGMDAADHGGSVPRLVVAAGCGTWSPAFRELSAASGGQRRMRSASRSCPGRSMPGEGTWRALST